jgi:hypothetical protein
MARIGRKFAFVLAVAAFMLAWTPGVIALADDPGPGGSQPAVSSVADDPGPGG